MLNKKMNFEDGSERFAELTQQEQEIIVRWIQENLLPCKTPLYKATSYLLKHLLERDTRVYCTNSQFKEAMLRSGYEPVNPTARNWYFRISRKSSAFQ